MAECRDETVRGRMQEAVAEVLAELAKIAPVSGGGAPAGMQTAPVLAAGGEAAAVAAAAGAGGRAAEVFQLESEELYD